MRYRARGIIARSKADPADDEYSLLIMDFIAIFIIVMILGTIVLAPVFGAESRRLFLRPDLKPRGGWAPARPWERDQ
jgi:hypothetical protein